MTAKKSSAKKSAPAAKKSAKAAKTSAPRAKKSASTAAKRTPTARSAPVAKKISGKIENLGDWRGATLARVRELIHEADPDIKEEWKWAKATSPGVPVWSHDGIVCTGETYKQTVKLTFACGASLDDPNSLFNSSLEGNVRRAIDIREGESINTTAFKKLIKAAVAANVATSTARKSVKGVRK